MRGRHEQAAAAAVLLASCLHGTLHSVLDRPLPAAMLPPLWRLATAPSNPPAGPQVSEAVQRLLRLLDTLWRWVEETPPAAHTLRYGNPAYRTWFARMAEAAPQARGGQRGAGLAGARRLVLGRMLWSAGQVSVSSPPLPHPLSAAAVLVRVQLTAEVLPAGLEGAAVELAGYLSDSFGNATRIDYGTGGWMCRDVAHGWARRGAALLPAAPVLWPASSRRCWFNLHRCSSPPSLVLPPLPPSFSPLPCFLPTLPQATKPPFARCCTAWLGWGWWAPPTLPHSSLACLPATLSSCVKSRFAWVRAEGCQQSSGRRNSRRVFHTWRARFAPQDALLLVCTHACLLRPCMRPCRRGFELASPQPDAPMPRAPLPSAPSTPDHSHSRPPHPTPRPPTGSSQRGLTACGGWTTTSSCPSSGARRRRVPAVQLQQSQPSVS